MVNKQKILTKSKYLIGLKCLRHLWMLFHEPDKLPEDSVSAKFRMEQGVLVGEFAKKKFLEGVELSGDFKENLKQTNEILKEKKVLFEAGFLVDGLFSRADILVPKGNKWDLIEVKSGTSVKVENIDDVGFQKFVMEKAGLKINKCFLMHTNNEFVKNGEIDPEEFFILEDITSEVDEIMGEVPKNIKKMQKVINIKTPPKITVASGCENRMDCPCEDCWNFLKEGHVLELYRGKQKGVELLNEDVLYLKDISEDVPLNKIQEVQVYCAKNNKIHVNKEKIKEFLETLKEPLYYLDFETFSTAMPLFDNTRPYQRIPFQFSLHVVDKGKVTHHEFLAKAGQDPRKEFLHELKKVLGTEGSIVVYNQAFENGVLKELAENFPKYKNWVEEVLDRVADLLIPFRNFDYYNPKQHGSASIKAVLPVITGKSYEGLEIADGDTASISFLKEGDKEKVRENLLKYCALDTEGMVLIVEELKKLI